MKARSKELLDRSVAAMVAAIEIYNKPGFQYRTESFAILSVNAWELLLKAKWLAENSNKQRSLYVFASMHKRNGSKSKKKYIKRSRSDNPLTHGLDYLAKKLVESGDFDDRAWGNVQILIELRDCAVHFYNKSTGFSIRLQEIGAACVKNFATATKEWFNRELTEFSMYLMPLAFVGLAGEADTVLLNSEEKNFLSFLGNFDSADNKPDSPYSVTVNIDIKFTRSKVNSSLNTRLTNDPDAPAIRLTDEQIRERYKWDYDELTRRCRKRYQDFKLDKKYHQIRRKLLKSEQFGKVRFLDPGNPKSQKKPFFDPNILSKLDKHYKRKSINGGIE